MAESLDVDALKQAVQHELRYRRIDDTRGVYGLQRGGAAELHGTTAAVKIHAILGIPLEVSSRELAVRIIAYQRPNGLFSDKGPGHALCMVLQALNLLGAPIPDNVGPFAPSDSLELKAWIERHDWNGTHKELCSCTAPLLAEGLCLITGLQYLQT